MPKFLRLLAAAAMLHGRAASPHAVDPAGRAIPAAPSKIIVSAPPGGGVDIVARVIADRLAKLWGQPFVVENRPGRRRQSRRRGGRAGRARRLHAPRGAAGAADHQRGAVPQAQLRSRRVRAARDHDRDPEHAGGARRTSRPTRCAELIAYAKANPGKVNFGSQGVGTTPHLTGELFARLTGTKLTHVPYRGTAQAVNDLVAGHLDLLFFQLDSVREQYQAEEGEDAGGDDGRAGRRTCRRCRPWTRPASQGFRSDTWNALAAPPKHAGGDRRPSSTPAINEVLKQPGDRRASARHEHDAGRRHAGRDQAIHPEETARWGDVIRAAGISVD